MSDFLVGLGLCVGITVVAVVLLAGAEACQRRRQRLKKEQRPLPEQIAEVHARAIEQIQHLEPLLSPHPRLPPEAFAWVPIVLDFYRRLAELSADPEPSTEDVERLAEETAQYIRQNRVKGMVVATEARLLADLVRRR